MPEFQWFERVDDRKNLLQGDILCNCPILVPTIDFLRGKEEDIEAIEYDVVIMSQSCDLVQNKLTLVLVCPLSPLEALGKRNDFLNSIKGKEALRRGNVTGYHLINECTIKGFERGFSVIDFRSTFSVPFEYLKSHIDKKPRGIRLKPPYREHMSQAFARFFMRGGLPVDIPPFRKK